MENLKKALESRQILIKGKAGIRGVPDGSGPEGRGPTGRRKPPQKPKKEDFESEDEFFIALKRWQYSQKSKTKT